MGRLEVSSNQRNLTNVNAIKICEKLAGLSASAFPNTMTGARVYLTAGGAEGIEAGMLSPSVTVMRVLTVHKHTI
jgi:hypothetical protein